MGVDPSGMPLDPKAFTFEKDCHFWWGSLDKEIISWWFQYGSHSHFQKSDALAVILTWMAATRSATHLSLYQKNLIPVGHKTRQKLKKQSAVNKKIKGFCRMNLNGYDDCDSSDALATSLVFFLHAQTDLPFSTHAHAGRLSLGDSSNACIAWTIFRLTFANMQYIVCVLIGEASSRLASLQRHSFQIRNCKIEAWTEHPGDVFLLVAAYLTHPLVKSSRDRTGQFLLSWVMTGVRAPGRDRKEGVSTEIAMHPRLIRMLG